MFQNYKLEEARLAIQSACPETRFEKGRWEGGEVLLTFVNGNFSFALGWYGGGLALLTFDFVLWRLDEVLAMDWDDSIATISERFLPVAREEVKKHLFEIRTRRALGRAWLTYEEVRKVMAALTDEYGPSMTLAAVGGPETTVIHWSVILVEGPEAQGPAPKTDLSAVSTFTGVRL